MEKSKTVLEEVALQLLLETLIEDVTLTKDAGLQILIETLDSTLGRRPGKVVVGMGNARHWDIIASSSKQAMG